MRISRELAADMAIAHGAGNHDNVRREGCPECEDRPLRDYPSAAELAERPRPGRPPVGAPVQVRLPADLVAWADENAGAAGQSRAAFLRDALQYARGLNYPAAVNS
jgi:ribbon-helix-helix CopG family protein